MLNLYYLLLTYFLKKSVAPVLKTLRQPSDVVEEYKQEFGYIGIALSNAVSKARTQPSVTTPATTAVITNCTPQQHPQTSTPKPIPQTGTKEFFVFAV